ncbi:hypothetical protein J6397_28105 [Rhodococcus qingshengii]|uniref:hypothetical protein n=1 Tax=Rhodococcus TaxID=1827 RepID=UPI00136D58E9|nr:MULTISPECIES: hypothetical protein [Rhodococcus]MBP1054027.1 hypothetical protein [Rhodococcus qingshengii]MBP2527573.1 uncharacterized protein YkwD [Rhodococcus sp. PvP104]MDA3637642.1 hypothetical protein [Rhodococcus sp. C-2]MYV31698.1 hypothetical protein [Rhodococcus erythropolis]
MTSYTAKLAAITTVSALLAYDALGEDLPRPEVDVTGHAESAAVRALSVVSAVAPYAEAADDDADFETPISDLVANLRHLAAALGVDWDAVNRHAAGHYAEERADRR